MNEMIRSILMGLGCLSILGFVGCGMMGAGMVVAVDRAADQMEKQERERNKSPWDK